MGQSSSAAKCSEPLESCLNCETCDTEQEVCAAWKRDVVSAFRRDMRMYSESNTSKLNTLNAVHNQLVTRESDVRQQSDAAKTNAETASVEAKFWSDVHSLATGCRANLLACQRKEATAIREREEYDQKFQDVDDMPWFMSSESEQQMKERGQTYSDCMEKKLGSGLVWNKIWDDETNQLKSEFESEHELCIAGLPTGTRHNSGKDGYNEFGGPCASEFDAFAMQGFDVRLNAHGR